MKQFCCDSSASKRQKLNDENQTVRI